MGNAVISCIHKAHTKHESNPLDWQWVVLIVYCLFMRQDIERFQEMCKDGLLGQGDYGVIEDWTAIDRSRDGYISIRDGLDIILAQWRHPVASSEALDLLHWAICAVTYRRIAMAIKMACFLGVFVDCCLFACCPGGRWGNTEQVVALCRRPVASGVALDMPHWAMPSVLLRCTAVTIKMARG